MKFGYGPPIKNLEYLVFRDYISKKIGHDKLDNYYESLLYFHNTFKSYNDGFTPEEDLREEIFKETIDAIDLMTEQEKFNTDSSLDSELPNLPSLQLLNQMHLE